MPQTELWIAHCPTRADQRAARRVLADLREGEVSSNLEDLTFGPLDPLSRFLAGCGLCFLLIRSEQGRLLARGGPSADAVAVLVDGLLGRAPPPVVPPLGSAHISSLPPAVPAHREPWIECAVDQIVDGLHEGSTCFVFAWQLPGRSQIRLAHSLTASRDAVDECLKWFLRRRFGVCIEVPF